MGNFNEANTIQAMLYEAAGFNGWTPMDREFVPTDGNLGLPLIARWLKKSLLLLNRAKGLTASQADEIVRQIQGLYEGLVNPADLVERNKLGESVHGRPRMGLPAARTVQFRRQAL